MKSISSSATLNSHNHIKQISEELQGVVQKVIHSQKKSPSIPFSGINQEHIPREKLWKRVRESDSSLGVSSLQSVVHRLPKYSKTEPQGFVYIFVFNIPDGLSVHPLVHLLSNTVIL